VYRTSGKPSEVLKLESDFPVPREEKYPIVVKVHAAALNPVGYKMMEHFPSLLLKTPAVPESDYAGVIAGGQLPSHLKVGDEVFGIIPADSGQQKLGCGTLAEYTVASENTVVKKPANLSFVEAAGVSLAGLTAYQSLVDTAHIKAGSRVLINGATGGVGLWAVQIAKAVGCRTVATCSEPSFQLVKDLGADEVVDYKKDLYDTLASKYGSGEQMFDVVFDAIGVPDLYSHAGRYTKPEGIFVNISVDTTSAGGIAKAAVSVGSALLRPTWLGGSPITYKMVMLKGDQSIEGLRQLAKWLEEGKLKAIVDSEYAFEDALSAYEKMKSGRAKGKVVVKVIA